MAGLDRLGFSCSVVSPDEGLAEKVAANRPDLALVPVGDWLAGEEVGALVDMVKQASPVPVIVLVARDELDGFDSRLGFDDFIVSPYDGQELALRINRLLRHETGGEELLEQKGLFIDADRCEVTMDGEPVELTFREYELLKFLANHKGRVYTREALLNRVWGYDYYGGDRTVDVHIRRLRSKIEKGNNKYIDTVRNIGYRFRDK
jgi:DNA-binding response OmpR family regulator